MAEVFFGQSGHHQIVRRPVGDTDVLPSTQVTSTQGIIARPAGEILMMHFLAFLQRVVNFFSTVYL